MGENTKIEWADHTFNPWMGCSKVSEGCRNCYAENQMDHRWHKVQWGPGKARVRTSEAMWKKPLQWNAEAKKTGIRPRVFSLSLGDWLDPEVPAAWLADLLALIQVTPCLDWLLVTKRPEAWAKRMEKVFTFEVLHNHGAKPGRLSQAWEWYSGNIAPANVWLLASVEDQATTRRISSLLKIPAVVHGLSCEPLLGSVDLNAVERPDDAYMSAQGHTGVVTAIDEPDDYLYWQKKGIHWVICGGESGPNARPMHPDWARSLRDQCQAAGIPFHFKQWGEWAPGENAPGPQTRTETAAWFDGAHWNFHPVTVRQSEEMHCDDEPHVWRFGKKAAGRLLDGREWNEFPQVAAI